MKNKTTRTLMLTLFALATTTGAYADCGSVPYFSPFQIPSLLQMTGVDGGKEAINFDPLDIVVYEPAQRGIILWNGEEETLLLSTEIRTSQPASILEVIPFPTEPTVRLGDFKTFEKMQRLLIEKTMWRVASGGGVQGVELPPGVAEITFHEKMGAHDVVVVKVLDKSYFEQWVMEYMLEQQAVNAKIDPKFLQIIDNYLQRGFTWFVFDRIVTDSTLRSHEPIEFTFKSDHVYYPMEISTLETGKTTVDLLLLTPKPLTTYGELKFAVKRDDFVSITRDDLKPVLASWYNFMAFPEITMQRIRIRGDLSDLDSDLILK